MVRDRPIIGSSLITSVNMVQIMLTIFITLHYTHQSPPPCQVQALAIWRWARLAVSRNYPATRRDSYDQTCREGGGFAGGRITVLGIQTWTHTFFHTLFKTPVGIPRSTR